MQKLWNQKNIVRETFSFQRAHFPVDIFHFSAAIFANLRKDLTFLHNCIFLIFAISISCDSHRARTGHWQLLRRLITDLPLVTRSARARPAYQPRHNRPTGLYTHISPAYRQPLANWPIYGLVIGHYLCVLVEPNHTESQVLPGSRKRSTRKSKLFANLLVCRFQKV